MEMKGRRLQYPLIYLFRLEKCETQLFIRVVKLKIRHRSYGVCKESSIIINLQ